MDDEPKEWWQLVDWAGVVAFVLSVGVSVSMSLAMVGGFVGALWYGRPISEQGATLLATIFGAAIGALATFLGQSRGRNNK